MLDPHKHLLLQILFLPGTNINVADKDGFRQIPRQEREIGIFLLLKLESRNVGKGWMKFIFICKESFKPCQGSKFTQKRCKVGFMQLSFLDISTKSTGTSTWSAYMRPWSLLTCESILRQDPSNQTRRLWCLAPPCEQGVLMFLKKIDPNLRPDHLCTWS